jgi:hypothetical protein
LYAAYQTTQTNYAIQLESLKNNINAMDQNKIPSSELSFDTNINTMRSQLNNLDLSIQSIEKQIQNFDNTSNISLAQLKSQYLNLASNYEVLSNTLGGEIIKSPIDGVVKSKQALQFNKINPNTTLCQVVPLYNNAVKIQIYSPYVLDIGQKIVFLEGSKILGK